ERISEGLIALLLFRQSSEAIVDLLAGQRPVGVPYLHNAYPLEILVQPERSVILAEVFRQNGERQLRRAASAIPPFEARRAVVAEGAARIEGFALAVSVDNPDDTSVRTPATGVHLST